MPDPEEWNPATMGDWPHTPPFEVMRDLLAKDPNLFWKLDIGHIQNTLEAALDRLETVEQQWSKAVTLWNRSVDSKTRLQDRLDAAEALRERVANLIPLDLIHDKGRPGQPQDAFEAADRILTALAAAPTHVPPPRTAFLEHCEVEIYEGLTYVRLDDVMHLLSEGAPSEQQVERAANAMQNESGGFFSLESWRHLARVALTAAGVAPQEPLGDLVFRAAAAIAETQARRQNLPPEVIQGVTREHIQDAKAALTAAGVAPQVPNQNETKSGNNFVSLDPEKVAEVLLANAKSRYGGLLFEERAAARIAHALCEAYTEGKLT